MIPMTYVYILIACREPNNIPHINNIINSIKLLSRDTLFGQEVVVMVGATQNVWQERHTINTSSIIPLSYDSSCAASRNTLLDHISSLASDKDIVVFLDDDMNVGDTNWLVRLITPTVLHKRIAGVKGYRIEHGAHGFYTVDDPNNFDYLSGGWLALPYTVTRFLRFDESFKPNYWEDADYGLRLRQYGYVLECVGDVGLIHLNSLGDSATERKTHTVFSKKWQMRDIDALRKFYV